MEVFFGEKVYVSYKMFIVDFESEKYRFFVDGYFGIIGGIDLFGLRYNNKVFIIKDSDNDEYLENCVIFW